MVPRVYDFDDLDWPPAWLAHVLKWRHTARGLSLEWWRTRNDALGCSPMSALCDERLEEVHALAVAR
jgi:hypothetical protein